MCGRSRMITFCFNSKTLWQRCFDFVSLGRHIGPPLRNANMAYHCKLDWNISLHRPTPWRNAYITIIYHITDSWLNLLYGYDFYFLMAWQWNLLRNIRALDSTYLLLTSDYGHSATALSEARLCPAKSGLASSVSIDSTQHLQNKIR